MWTLNSELRSVSTNLDSLLSNVKGQTDLSQIFIFGRNVPADIRQNEIY